MTAFHWKDFSHVSKTPVVLRGEHAPPAHSHPTAGQHPAPMGCSFTPAWVRGWDPGYSGYSVICQRSKHFSFHPNTQDRTHTSGKAQTVLQPGTGDGATRSSRVTPPSAAFLAHHKCRNAAHWGEGFAKSLQGNVGFKGGHQNPRAQSSPPHCHHCPVVCMLQDVPGPPKTCSPSGRERPP